ncbi:hypothetical protein [Flavobacterium hungaricum]|uniref:hypothetical protein n=1 Tax=Flavobacterium hungaricum TaxID=2082725 RepID=UPI00187FC199|nr:hypothetical protein [Flavobacterium hungaricum]
MPNLEVDLVKKEGSLFWEFTKWDAINKSGKGNHFFVEVQTGKISKATYELVRKF